MYYNEKLVELGEDERRKARREERREAEREEGRIRELENAGEKQEEKKEGEIKF